MAEISMGANQKVALNLVGVGKAGGDTSAQFSGRAGWAEDGGGILALTPDATGLACEAVALGLVGTSIVTVTATDPKGVSFSATVTVDVVPALEETDHIEIVAGSPTDQ